MQNERYDAGREIPRRRPAQPERTSRTDAPQQRRSSAPTRQASGERRTSAPPAHRTAATSGARKPATGTTARRPVRKKKKKYRRVINTNFRVKFLTMLAIVAAVILGFTIFFKIQHIEVRGNTYYTADEIIAVSGVENGDNLLTIGKQTVAAKIMAELPYVSEVQIKRSLPSTLVITVGEFEVTYAITDSAGSWWLINREGRVLNTATESEADDHIIIKGLTISPPKLGDEIMPQTSEGSDDAELSAKKNAVIRVLSQLETQSYIKQIVTVDVSASYDITLWYGTQYQIRFGSTTELDYKMSYLQGVLDQLNSYQSGVIDITFEEGKVARFQPFQ